MQIPCLFCNEPHTDRENGFHQKGIAVSNVSLTMFPLSVFSDISRSVFSYQELLYFDGLEMSENAATVTRQYAERLISDAVTHGPAHAHTVKMAKWWLEEDPAALHKLFKVRGDCRRGNRRYG